MVYMCSACIHVIPLQYRQTWTQNLQRPSSVQQYVVSRCIPGCCAWVKYQCQTVIVFLCAHLVVSPPGLVNAAQSSSTSSSSVAPSKNIILYRPPCETRELCRIHQPTDGMYFVCETRGSAVVSSKSSSLHQVGKMPVLPMTEGCWPSMLAMSFRDGPRSCFRVTGMRRAIFTGGRVCVDEKLAGRIRMGTFGESLSGGRVLLRDLGALAEPYECDAGWSFSSRSNCSRTSQVRQKRARCVILSCSVESSLSQSAAQI